MKGLLLGLSAGILVVALAACTANPPPPIEATGSPKPTSAKPAKNTVVVAIDEIGPGLNPHLLADQSPTTVAVSSWVLPSVFRPAQDPTRPGAAVWAPDNSVLVSADVTSQAPFTVTYRLRDEAQWYDGAPIAAEDFHYLWQQMITQPGVVDAAGYRMIADVGSAAGGKVVTVTMRAPYPAWRELFTGLLPSHIIKDAPGGFQRGLADNIPSSGAQFHIKGSPDRGRDEILLDRNDRFWGQPAKTDQILLRRGGTPAQLADSVRSDDAQLALVHGGDATRLELSAIPGVRSANMVQPRQLQLALNGRFGALQDTRVRRGVLGLLDPKLLATVGRGFDSSSDPVRALVLSPSDPGYQPTEPPRAGDDAAYAALAEAGYTHVTGASGQVGRVVKNGGSRLRIRIGVDENDHTAVAVANTAADQLRSAGIDAGVHTATPSDLYGPDLIGGPGSDVVDAVVGWVRSGSDPATALASRYSCPPPANSTQTTSSQVDPELRAPSNLSGVCDPTLQPAIDSALRGFGDVPRIVADAEPRLWELATVLPIMQDNTVVAAGPGISGAALNGSVQSGPFADAAQWSRAGS